jgi:hypothetical protein
MDKEQYKQLQKLFNKQSDDLVMFYDALLNITPIKCKADILKSFHYDIGELGEQHKRIFKILDQ